MTIHRQYFFDSVRASLFGGSLSTDQVDGLNALLDCADALRLDDRQTAYVLATAYHETAQTLQPIAEYGKGSGKPYGSPAGPHGQCYYGRGYVQLTWYDNYQAQDKKLDLGGSLVQNADRALEAELAAEILFGGMIDGDFTGKALGDYITPEGTDFYNARRIVNGTDRATDIAGYATKFANAITQTHATVAA